MTNTNDNQPAAPAETSDGGRCAVDALLGSFDVVAFVDAVRKETKETRQGAVAMWGLETATGMFLGQKLIAEARQRLLKPNA